MSKNLAFAAAAGALVMAASAFLTWINGLDTTGWKLFSDSPDLYVLSGGTMVKAGSFCMQIPVFMLAFGLAAFVLELIKAAYPDIPRAADSVITSTAAFLGAAGIVLALLFAFWDVLGGTIYMLDGSMFYGTSGCTAGIGVWLALVGSAVTAAVGIWQAVTAFRRPADPARKRPEDREE